MKLLLCIFLVTSLVAKQEPLIESVTVNKNQLKIEVNTLFKEKYLTGDFFAEYDQDIDLSKLDYSIQIMPFIMNVVSIVWISGKDWYIDSMDEELFASLDTVKEVFRRMYPCTKWEGRLIPHRLVKNVPPFKPDTNRIALLFSGGLDSTTSSLYHSDKKQLLITAWGHWDLPLKDVKLWKTRKSQLLGFAEQHGHEATFVKSNYYSMLNRKVLDCLSKEITSWRIFAVEGIGWAGIAAPLMWLKGYPELRHASTITWDYHFPAAANPFIDDNIKFAQFLHLKHDLFDMNRMDKCRFLGQACKGKEKPFVRVCEEQIVANCGKCQKCMRTILEFYIVGEDPKEYGFSRPVDQVLKETRKFMAHHTTGSTTVWHFKHMQQYLQEMQKKGQPIHEDLNWMLTAHLGFDKKVTSDIRGQKQLDWHDFIDLLPDIEIPPCMD